MKRQPLRSVPQDPELKSAANHPAWLGPIAIPGPIDYLGANIAIKGAPTHELDFQLCPPQDQLAVFAP